MKIIEMIKKRVVWAQEKFFSKEPRANNTATFVLKGKVYYSGDGVKKENEQDGIIKKTPLAR